MVGFENAIGAFVMFWFGVLLDYVLNAFWTVGFYPLIPEGTLRVILGASFLLLMVGIPILLPLMALQGEADQPGG